MRKTIFWCLPLSSLLLFKVAMACTVNEIIGMHDNGAGQRAIFKACHHIVDDAPRCNLADVLVLTFAGKDNSDIDDYCGLCENPTCKNNAYGETSITSSMRAVRRGSQCLIPLPTGDTRRGYVKCN